MPDRPPGYWNALQHAVSLSVDLDIHSVVITESVSMMEKIFGIDRAVIAAEIVHRRVSARISDYFQRATCLPKLKEVYRD